MLASRATRRAPSRRCACWSTPPSASTRSPRWSAGRRRACIACWPRTAILRWRISPRSWPRSSTRRACGWRSACARWSSPHRREVQHHAASYFPGSQIFQRPARLVRCTRLDRDRLEFPFLCERHHLLQLLQVADVGADDADGALRDRRARVGKLPPLQPAEHVAAALAERGDAQRGGNGAADEVDRSRNALQLLRRLLRPGIQRGLRAELRRRRQLRFIDVAGDDVPDALRAQHGNADQADPAAADDRHPVLRAERGQLGARAVGGERRAGERRGEGFVDAGGVHQVLRVRREDVSGIGAGAIHAQIAGSGNAIVVLPRPADRALPAADPRIDDALLADFHSLSARSDGFYDAEGIMSRREGRHAAALLHVETLAAAEVEIAFPDMHVGMAHARARNPYEDFCPLGLRSLSEYFLQWPAVLDDLVADHASPAACSAWSMSHRMSSRVSMPTEMRTMSGVTPAFNCSASSICRCVVEAGWMTSVFASPMLARWLMNCAASMKRSPALAPPFTPKFSKPEAPLGRYFFANEKYLLSGSPG